MRRLIRSQVRGGDDGATFLEYGLMAALIAVVVAVAVGPLGLSVRDLFDDAANSF